MKFYHNPRCSKSRQSLQILQDNNADIEIVEYLKTNPTKQEITEIVKKLGMSPLELIRKGEADFKDNFKGKDLSDEQWIDAMVRFPKLMERPIFVKGDKAVIGRPPEKVLELYGA